MSARGRKLGVMLSEEHRHKIANSNILNRLLKFALGSPDIEMTALQVQVSLALMKKVLPDLTSVEYSGEMDHHISGETSDMDVARSIAMILAAAERKVEATKH